MKYKEYLENLFKERDKILDKLENLLKLIAKYPDLEIHENRWRKEYYCSASVNYLCDKYEVRNSCGCCSDSLIYLEPYIIDEETGIKIYSNPYSFTIGQNEPYLSTVFYESYPNKLKEMGFKQELIDEITVSCNPNYVKEYNDND